MIATNEGPLTTESLKKRIVSLSLDSAGRDVRILLVDLRGRRRSYEVVLHFIECDAERVGHVFFARELVGRLGVDAGHAGVLRVLSVMVKDDLRDARRGGVENLLRYLVLKHATRAPAVHGYDQRL